MCDIYIYNIVYFVSLIYTLCNDRDTLLSIYILQLYSLWVQLSLVEYISFHLASDHCTMVGGFGVMWADLANTTTRGSQGRSSWGISGAWRCVCAVQLSRPSCSTLYIRVSEAIDELVLIVGVIDVGVTPFLSLVYNVSEHYQIEAQMGQSSRSFRYWPDLTA